MRINDEFITRERERRKKYWNGFLVKHPCKTFNFIWNKMATGYFLGLEFENLMDVHSSSSTNFFHCRRNKIIRNESFFYYKNGQLFISSAFILVRNWAIWWILRDVLEYDGHALKQKSGKNQTFRRKIKIWGVAHDSALAPHLADPGFESLFPWIFFSYEISSVL